MLISFAALLPLCGSSLFESLLFVYVTSVVYFIVYVTSVLFFVYNVTYVVYIVVYVTSVVLFRCI